MTEEPPPAEREADAAARAGRLAEARRLLEQAVAEAPARQQGWMKLAAMCRAAGDYPSALSAVSRALAIDPLDFSALLAKAVLLEKSGDGAAGEAYGHALAQRPPAGQEPDALKAMLAHAEQRWGEHRKAELERMRALLPDEAALGEEERSKVERFCANIARVTRPWPQQPTHFHYPGLPVLEFHHRSHFPWLGPLEAATAEIAAEFAALMKSEAAELVPYVQYPDDVPLRQWQALNHKREWTAIHLLRMGERVDKNARHCPATMRLIESFPIPRAPGRTPNAMFSLLAPHTRIPPHNGVDNSRLVVHLPLIVPPGCGFRVGAETREWEVGRAFVFDDTIEHEAWNDSGALRVVLIFDIWAWALSEAERGAVAAIVAGRPAAVEGA